MKLDKKVLGLNDILEEMRYKNYTIQEIIRQNPDWLALQCDAGKIQLDDEAIESLDIRLWDTLEDD